MVDDLRGAIAKVMSKGNNSLPSMNMWKFPGGLNDEGKFKSISSHKLSFDSQQNQLEPIYYWFLDFMGQVGWKDVIKTVDNFMASPGSGQFSEMSMKATKMQEEGMKILGGMNQIIKSVLNLIYDLKEFELRLENYKDAKSEDKNTRTDGMLALKQIWLDNVDIKKGRGAIHQMASMEMGFSTLREAFMMADGPDGARKLNSEDIEKGGSGLINDSVMRILIPRLSEFEKWVDYSHQELTKRFSIEKSYLKSQVETVKLYSQWMKPYLVNAEKLRQKGFDKDAALVSSFSTTMFELQLMGKRPVGVNEDKFKGYKTKRGYNEVIFITLKYRGHVSQRVTQKGDYGFGMGGLVDVYFDSYSLNDEELKAAEKMLEDEDLKKSMEFSMDVAGDALKELQKDLDYFLKTKEQRDADDEENKKKEEKKKEVVDINPFAALFGLFWTKKEKKKVKKGDEVVLKPEEIRKDNFVEKTMRAAGASGATAALYLIYDVYKKAHRMASAPGPGFATHDVGAIEELKKGGDVGWKDVFEGRGD